MQATIPTAAKRSSISKRGQSAGEARTWKIRDQLPNGKWGQERDVTLAQFLAEHEIKTRAAMSIFTRNAASV